MEIVLALEKYNSLKRRLQFKIMNFSNTSEDVQKLSDAQLDYMELQFNENIIERPIEEICAQLKQIYQEDLDIIKEVAQSIVQKKFNIQLKF